MQKCYYTQYIGSFYVPALEKTIEFVDLLGKSLRSGFEKFLLSRYLSFPQVSKN